jgi:hypothetical protein
MVLSSFTNFTSSEVAFFNAFAAMPEMAIHPNIVNGYQLNIYNF